MASQAHALAEAKKVLRREYLARILSTPVEVRLAEQAGCERRFSELEGFARSRVVCVYVSAFPEELDTRPLLRRVLELGKALVCPRVDRAARRLVLHGVDDPEIDLVAGAMGIPEPRTDRPVLEPEAIDWLLAPGLAFDEAGYRLGRGGGYYDRLIPRLAPGALAWALCFESQWATALPRAAHDVPLRGVASASRIVGPW